MRSSRTPFILLATLFRLMTMMSFMMILQYRLRDIGASLIVISSVSAVTGGIQSISSPLWGKIADGTGLRGRLLLIIGAAAAFLYPVYGFLSVPLLFLLLAGLIAFFEAGFNPVAMSLMSELSGEDKKLRSKNLALLNAASAAGILLGRLSLSGALSLWSVENTLFIISIIAFLAAIPPFFIPSRQTVITGQEYFPRSSDNGRKRVRLLPRREDMKIKGIWAVYVGTFIRNIGVAGFISVSALYMKEGIGLSESYSMLVSAIDPLFMFIAHLYFGQRMVRFGIKRTMLLGTFVTIASFTSFLFAGSWFLTILGWVFIGLAYGAFHNASVTFISFHFPSSRRGEGIGYIWTANTLGIMLGPVISGALSEISYSLMLYAMITFSVAGLILILLFVEKDSSDAFT